MNSQLLPSQKLGEFSIALYYRTIDLHMELCTVDVPKMISHPSLQGVVQNFPMKLLQFLSVFVSLGVFFGPKFYHSLVLQNIC